MYLLKKLPCGLGDLRRRRFGLPSRSLCPVKSPALIGLFICRPAFFGKYGQRFGEQAAQTPLEWLGGPEETVLAEKHLRMLRQHLLGQWVDQCGSIYGLTLNRNNDEYLDVRTQRPTGLLIIKRALLRLRANSTAAVCHWGGDRFALVTCGDGTVFWRDRRGKVAYLWSKLQ